MKRLLIAAAIVCAAAVVQAATANWNTDYTMVTGESEARTSAIAYTWAIVESATSDFSGYSFDGGTLTGGTAVGTGNSSVDLYGNTKGSLTGTAGNYYALLIHTDENGGYWGISSAVQAATNPTDASGNTLNAITFQNGKDVFGYGENAMVANIADAGSVPEPTSGLLMLLGVAGLALRRRRA